MNDVTMFEQLTDLHIKDDIGMYYCGKRINTKNHIYGPEIKSHYLFVLVNKGRAVLPLHNALEFGEHDLLVMHQGERMHYKALDDWSICWLGLYGKSVEKYIELLGISPKKPIMHIAFYNELKAVMEKIYDLSKDAVLASKLSINGLIYEFFSILLKCTSNEYKPDIADAALKIIDYNFCSNISIDKIAEYLFVDSAYFSRKFKERAGVSPKKYILNKRIEKAKELLRVTDANICEIANSVGYDDQFYFCKIFKKYTGLSPSKYRKSSYSNFVFKEV